MKGTRLWQEARSPLISGRSRAERPFWRDVLLAWFVAVALNAVIAYTSALPSQPSRFTVGKSRVSGSLAAALGGYAFATVPAAIGALTGVWLARRMGWRRPWLAGGAVGLLAGMLWLAMSATEAAR